VHRWVNFIPALVGQMNSGVDTLYHFQQKKKPSKDQGKTLTTLGFLDTFYCPWTVFIFPGRDLFSVYKHVKGK